MSLADRNRLTEQLIRFRAAKSSEERSQHLLGALHQLGLRTELPVADGKSHPESDLEVALDFPSRRLAVYGSLAPGEANHRLVHHLKGRWSTRSVRGDLHTRGWGLTLGYRGFTWRADGPKVAVSMLESDELPEHWTRLDAFEGPEYVRVLVPVEDDSGSAVFANLYAIRAGSAPGS